MPGVRHSLTIHPPPCHTKSNHLSTRREVGALALLVLAVALEEAAAHDAVDEGDAHVGELAIVVLGVVGGELLDVPPRGGGGGVPELKGGCSIVP